MNSANKKTPIERKIVFAVGQGTSPGTPMIVMGMPAGAWVYMKDGNTHHFDFTNIGIPLQLVLYGGKDHGDCMQKIESVLAAEGVAYDDRRRDNFGIKGLGE